jgi:predicted nucleic acid-binding protein
MYLLDTNALISLLEGDDAVLNRFEENLGQIWVSSVAAEERLVGVLSGINRARAPRTSLSLPKAHEKFVEALQDIRDLPFLAYSDTADVVYKTFTAAQIRIGAQDCRIAAQAMAHGLTVVTRNLRDFEAIGVSCVDWSA